MSELTQLVNPAKSAPTDGCTVMKPAAAIPYRRETVIIQFTPVPKVRSNQNVEHEQVTENNRVRTEIESV